MFLALLGFFLLSSLFGSPGIAHSETTGLWIADESSEPKIDGNSISCDGSCYAMWKDGDCVSSGDHYWRINFEDEVWVHALQLTNKDKFAKKVGYGDKFRQNIKSGTTVGILASFSAGKIKGYFKYNNQILGQVFDLDATTLSRVCPAIKFYGPGRITITKETEIPSQPFRKEPKNVAEIQGRWTSYSDNIKFGEEPLPRSNIDSKPSEKDSRKNLATISIEPISNSTVGQYLVHLEVINEILLPMRVYEGSWRSTTGAVSTRMGGSPERMKLEYQMTELVQSPDSVEIISGNLILHKGNMTVTFVR